MRLKITFILYRKEFRESKKISEKSKMLGNFKTINKERAKDIMEGCASRIGMELESFMGFEKVNQYFGYARYPTGELIEMTIEED